MKKFLSIFIIICLFITITGCNTNQTEKYVSVNSPYIYVSIYSANYNNKVIQQCACYENIIDNNYKNFKYRFIIVDDIKYLNEENIKIFDELVKKEKFVILYECNDYDKILKFADKLHRVPTTEEKKDITGYMYHKKDGVMVNYIINDIHDNDFYLFAIHQFIERENLNI